MYYIISGYRTIALFAIQDKQNSDYSAMDGISCFLEYVSVVYVHYCSIISVK